MFCLVTTCTCWNKPLNIFAHLESDRYVNARKVFVFFLFDFTPFQIPIKSTSQRAAEWRNCQKSRRPYNWGVNDAGVFAKQTTHFDIFRTVSS